ncbi:hypothetical protein ACIQ9Q_13800 [Streptomyces sp. NPDC094438]|uniref:hypothetical protein n=1 Tax=Streptomyces sp. NPDC094438 TaxID=3366061 RepID=UPI003824B1DB
MTTQILERPASLPVPGDEPDNVSATTLQTAMPYRIGTPDTASRYPVIVGDDWVIGHMHRWHRDWWVDSSIGEHNLGRPPKGKPGEEMAAEHLTKEYAAGCITAVPLKQIQAAAPKPLLGPVPLLHPRMPATDRNIKSAITAFAGLAEHHWRAVLTGFPGSDNHWYLSCELCPWEGPKFWSHLRGRNGAPPSAHRHEGGCIGKDKVRELITAYQQ